MGLYRQLIQSWYPNTIQTKCEALARFRYKRLQQKSHRGCKLIERQKLELIDGKALIMFTAEFRRVI